MLTTEPFWMVVGYSVPYVRHKSAVLACKEAQRLARKHPGTDFYVLKTVCGYAAKDPSPPPLQFVAFEPVYEKE